MTTDFSIYEMIVNSGVVVQIVLAILLLASIASWAIIFRKVGELKRAEGSSRSFEDDFWSGIDLAKLYRRVDGQKRDAAPLARIFGAGFREFARLVRHGQPSTAALGSARRAMDATGSRELDSLERSMGFLATVGSTAPYVGLFGTVWGIMAAFQGLGHAQQATLQMVAPGISEALIATAMGLFAAIPATVAYNRFAQRVDRLSGRFESFCDEFSNVLEHHQASEDGKKA
ncbi:MAG: protein TolQ [Gammaproteobacteria bacterium]|nr:protein TolQ [Gammaproteobacteria bacterium]